MANSAWSCFRPMTPTEFETLRNHLNPESKVLLATFFDSLQELFGPGADTAPVLWTASSRNGWHQDSFVELANKKERARRTFLDSRADHLLSAWQGRFGIFIAGRLRERKPRSCAPGVAHRVRAVHGAGRRDSKVLRGFRGWPRPSYEASYRSGNRVLLPLCMGVLIPPPRRARKTGGPYPLSGFRERFQSSAV